MDFTLDEQQTDVRELAAGLIDRHVARYPAASPTGTDWFDQDLWADLGAAGLLGIAVPEEHGGSGAGFIEQCLLLEVAARAAARLFLVETAVLAALPLARFGTTEQRERLVAPFCEGGLVLTSAVRTDPVQPRGIDARRDEDRWVLTGSVGHVPLADVAARVLVRVSGEDERGGYVLVDPRAEGVTLTLQSSVDRAPRWHLRLDGTVVSAEDVLVEPGGSTAELDRWLADHGVAARCVAQAGSADAALRMTARHVTEREQFGRPVGSFQAVAHRVADAYVDVTAMRLTAWRAAWLLDHDEPAAQPLAVAAWYACDASSRVGEAAMHLHGGLSVDLDYPLHRHYLSLRQGELALGGPARRLQALGDLVAVA